MAISKLNFNSLNVTPSANAAIGFDSGADDLETGSGGGAIKFIKKLTASSSSTLSFVDGASSVVLDNTYKEYLFIFNNIHAQTDEVWFQFQTSTDGGSNYNTSCTSTQFVAHHNEADGNTGINYYDSRDHANDTGYIYLAGWEQGNDNDQATSGTLKLYNPSDTTFVKHWLCTLNISHPSNFTANGYSAGYFNTTSAINAISFRLTSGNIDAGDITLYGIN